MSAMSSRQRLAAAITGAAAVAVAAGIANLPMPPEQATLVAQEAGRDAGFVCESHGRHAPRVTCRVDAPFTRGTVVPDPDWASWREAHPDWPEFPQTMTDGGFLLETPSCATWDGGCP